MNRYSDSESSTLFLTALHVDVSLQEVDQLVCQCQTNACVVAVFSYFVEAQEDILKFVFRDV